LYRLETPEQILSFVIFHQTLRKCQGDDLWVN